MDKKNILFNENNNEDEILKHSNETNDMVIIMKQLKDYIKPENKNAGYDANIKKEGNTIIVYKDNKYVKIKNNGLQNNFYKGYEWVSVVTGNKIANKKAKYYKKISK